MKELHFNLDGVHEGDKKAWRNGTCYFAEWNGTMWNIPQDAKMRKGHFKPTIHG